MIILLGLEVGWRVPLVVFSGRPSSTSAHSAGVEREGGRCSWRRSFCVSVRPLAQTADPGGESGQVNCTLEAPICLVNPGGGFFLDRQCIFTCACNTLHLEVAQRSIRSIVALTYSD